MTALKVWDPSGFSPLVVSAPSVPETPGSLCLSSFPTITPILQTGYLFLIVVRTLRQTSFLRPVSKNIFFNCTKVTSSVMELKWSGTFLIPNLTLHFRFLNNSGQGQLQDPAENDSNPPLSPQPGLTPCLRRKADMQVNSPHPNPWFDKTIFAFNLLIESNTSLLKDHWK